MLARLSLSALLFVCSAAWADNVALRGARIAQQSTDGTIVEFTLSSDVRTTAHDTSPDGIEIRLRSASVSAQFDQSDTTYDGDLDAVDRVSLEGSGAGGYRLVVHLGWPMAIELLQQPDPQHIALRLVQVAQPQQGASAPALAEAASPAPADTASPAATESDVPPPTGDPSGGAAAGDAYEQALAEGRQAAMTQEYHRAIVLYTKAAESQDVAVRQEALEMLAMARERNHQDAQAKLIYQQFLAQYPDAEQAPRIQQRLSGLITRDLPVQKKLKEPVRGASDWDAVGGLSQFYQRNALSVNGDSEQVGVDALFTDADLSVTRRGENLDLGLRFSGSQLYDFGPAGDTQYQVATVYLEGEVIDWGVKVRVGRQTPHSSGVLSRFDGAQVEYQVQPWLSLGVLGGYAVDYSGNNGFTTDRPLYGVNAEISVADGKLEFAPFYMEQEANGLLDRRAVGLETRLFTENASVFSLVDYDIYHDALNTTYLMANLRFGEGWSTYANFDRRRSPYITTENALIGQGVNNLGDLEQTYNDHEILQLADDRTAELTLASVGFDKQVSSRFEVGSDFAYSDYAETTASGNVDATPSRQDYYYTLRFRADEIYGKQTYAALFLRYGVGPDSDISSVYWNNRFIIRNVWQLYPRIRVDYRDFTDLNQTQWTIAPSLRLDYRPRQGVYFEFEAGYDQTQRDMATSDMKMTGYYFRLGYRTLF